MDSFLNRHEKAIDGVVSTFDRLIFKGHLTGFFADGAFGSYLRRRGVLLKDAGKFFEAETKRLRDHVLSLAEARGRPVEYLASAQTRAKGCSKEELARAIAERDEVKEGLVCMFSAVEPCTSFAVVGNRAMQRLEVVRRRRKCLHLYLYLIDAQFGWMHVRIQTWAPYEIQVYVNGREWLARQLEAEGIGYERSTNKITWVEDFEATDRLCTRLAHNDWPRFLEPLASWVNPLLAKITQAGFEGYWWVIDQSEYASDILFKSRRALEAVYGDLVEASMTGFDAVDVMRFLGRKPHHAFKGEVTLDRKQRPQGCRVRFRLKANALKLYDHANVLRVETTINNPQEFRVLRPVGEGPTQQMRWCPMRKGVANFWRYAQVAHAANGRLLEALADAPLKGQATAELDGLCRSRRLRGRRIARFNPVDQETGALFVAVLCGDFMINGFRNRDLQAKLYPNPPRSAAEAKRRTQRVSRLIAKLRGHRLLAKVKNARLYRVTPRGIKAMWPAIRFRRRDFPADFRAAENFLAHAKS
jgi:hypothetical protein